MEKIRKLFYRLIPETGNKTYAQYGEDIIIDGLCNTIGISNPKYIDIGTHHPTNLSNTYYFYKKGSYGVCIEPSKKLAKVIEKKRRRDIVEAIGVGSTTNTTPRPYYVLTAQTMNTFSEKNAEQTINAPQMYGSQRIEAVEYIPIIGINELFDKYIDYYGDIVSIDTEGMDEEIIYAINFQKYRPKIFCIETITQDSNHMFQKNMNIIDLLKKNGYIVYADTYVNTIFVDQKLWKEGTTIL